MTGSRKTRSIPDRFVAAGGAVQARHLHRGPGIVVAVKSRKPAILALAERRDRHAPAGVELLAIQGLRWKQRAAVVERHGTPFTIPGLASRRRQTVTATT